MSNRNAGDQFRGEVLDDGSNHHVEIGDLVMEFKISSTERFEADAIGGLHIAIGCQIRPPACEPIACVSTPKLVAQWYLARR